jgi:hypothetical protein
MKTRELDLVLGGCWQQFGRPGRFSAGQLADVASGPLRREISASEIGSALQAYRRTEARNFDVACQGYGVAAKWRILGVHNHVSTRRRERTLVHKDYSVEDALRREGRDLAYEILPPLKTNGGDKAREECRSIVLDFRSRCYGRLGATGLSGADISRKAEAAYAPAAKWYADAFGESP